MATEGAEKVIVVVGLGVWSPTVSGSIDKEGLLVYAMVDNALEPEEG